MIREAEEFADEDKKVKVSRLHGPLEFDLGNRRGKIGIHGNREKIIHKVMRLDTHTLVITLGAPDKRSLSLNAMFDTGGYW